MRETLRKKPGVDYKEVPGFAGYLVGSDGTVWSNRFGSRWGLFQGKYKRLKDSPDKDGYFCYRLYNGTGVSHFAHGHSLVLVTFVGPCPEGLEGCHNDGNPANNQLNNLRWGTRTSNAADCISHGRRPRHERHGRAKIENRDAFEIMRLVADGCSKASVGRCFGISGTQVSRIVSGQQWKGLSDVGVKQEEE